MVGGVGHVDVGIVGHRRCCNLVLVGQVVRVKGTAEGVELHRLSVEIRAAYGLWNIGVAAQCLGSTLVGSCCVFDGNVALTVYDVVGVGVVLRHGLKLPSGGSLVRPIAYATTHVDSSTGC